MRAHALAEGDDLATVPARDFTQHPQAVDVRGKHRDDDGLFGPRDDPVERLPDALLAAGGAACVHIRGVAEQEPHALASELLKTRDVERLTVRRSVVELEVSRVHHQSAVGPDGERGGVGDGVGDTDRLHLERSHALPRARRYLLQAHVIEDLVIRRPLAHESQSVARPEHGHVESAEEIRDCADVVRGHG
jgi:hypothetical protein